MMKNPVSLLLVAVFVYSTSGIFSKLASEESFLSIPYLFYFGFVIIVLGIYAVLWQIALKKILLSKAYLYKSFAIVLGLIYARLFFNETISPNNVIGAISILAGLWVLNSKGL